uniref:Uncharacterized protein n=1 Tax=Oryza meridionalis TaxID=40149 RepID=A0A0E0EXN0_9ORYZ
MEGRAGGRYCSVHIWYLPLCRGDGLCYVGGDLAMPPLRQGDVTAAAAMPGAASATVVPRDGRGAKEREKCEGVQKTGERQEDEEGPARSINHYGSHTVVEVLNEIFSSNVAELSVQIVKMGDGGILDVVTTLVASFSESRLCGVALMPFIE